VIREDHEQNLRYLRPLEKVNLPGNPRTPGEKRVAKQTLLEFKLPTSLESRRNSRKGKKKIRLARKEEKRCSREGKASEK